MKSALGFTLPGMRRLFPVLVAAGLGVGVASCSGGSGKPGAPLDCAYLASENCWKTTVQAALPCLPSGGGAGTLSTDKRTCTYSSGEVITFAQPVVLPATTDQNWDFTITTNGQTCMHFVWQGTAFTLDVGGQTVSEQLTPPASLVLTCPDGVTHRLASLQDIFNCPDTGTAGGLPGISVSSDATFVNFGLIDTSSDLASSSVTLFHCLAP